MAADSVEESASTLRAVVYNYIIEHDGATYWEIHEATGLRYSTVGARLSELKRDGRIMASGQRRKNPSGRWADVLVKGDGTPSTRKPSLSQRLDMALGRIRELEKENKELRRMLESERKGQMDMF
jgi:predicted alternative tryptophan synthase beta-subunit